MTGSSPQRNGFKNGGVNGSANGKRKAGDTGDHGDGDGEREGERKRIKALAPLALPADVVAEGIRVTRGCLDVVCEIENE